MRDADDRNRPFCISRARSPDGFGDSRVRCPRGTARSACPQSPGNPVAPKWPRSSVAFSSRPNRSAHPSGVDRAADASRAPAARATRSRPDASDIRNPRARPPTDGDASLASTGRKRGRAPGLVPSGALRGLPPDVGRRDRARDLDRAAARAGHENDEPKTAVDGKQRRAVVEPDQRIDRRPSSSSRFRSAVAPSSARQAPQEAREPDAAAAARRARASVPETAGRG